MKEERGPLRALSEEKHYKALAWIQNRAHRDLQSTYLRKAVHHFNLYTEPQNYFIWKQANLQLWKDTGLCCVSAVLRLFLRKSLC